CHVFDPGFRPNTGFNARQLLWLNLITDILPEIALAVDPAEADVMKRPPRDARRPTLTRSEYRTVGKDALSLALASLGTSSYGMLWGRRPDQIASLAFATLTSSQLLYALSARSETHNIFDHEAEAQNPYLSKSILGSMVAFLIAQINPALRSMLGTSRINLADALVCGTTAFGSCIATELMKADRRRNSNGDTRKQ